MSGAHLDKHEYEDGHHITLTTKKTAGVSSSRIRPWWEILSCWTPASPPPRSKVDAPTESTREVRSKAAEARYVVALQSCMMECVL
jgi:hypothetical protein